MLLHTTVGQHVQDKEAALALVAARKRTLARRIDELRGAQAVTARQRQAVDVTTTELGVRQDELGDARGLSPDWSLPIEGTSAFTAPELAEWFAQHGVVSKARADVTLLAADYIAEGGAQRIRGDMAFAQSVLETGSFTNDDTIRLNNFTGIGHCDSCATGFTFGTPDLGVHAQIQLLASYSDREVKMVHPLVDRRLHGPSGCCQTWRTSPTPGRRTATTEPRSWACTERCSTGSWSIAGWRRWSAHEAALTEVVVARPSPVGAISSSGYAWRANCTRFHGAKAWALPTPFVTYGAGCASSETTRLRR